MKCKNCGQEYKPGYIGMGTGYLEHYCSKECAKKAGWKLKMW